MQIFLHYILPPLIGALIGYVTNWIAVKMLFRPLYPKHIGKLKLPFTPGIIPKRKDALAKAIGSAVGDTLLTSKDIENAFCGEDVKSAILSEFADTVSVLTEKSLHELWSVAISEEAFEEKRLVLADVVSEKIAGALDKLHVGDALADVAGNAVMEKVKSSPLGMFVGEKTIRPVAKSMAKKVDVYLSEHGKEKLLPVVKKEIDSLSEAPFKSLLQNAGIDRDGNEKILALLYDKAFLPIVGEAVKSFDIAAEVEKKIKDMDVKELERLCLSVMKKELSAITWLGGLIGLLLGIVNIFL